MEISSPRRGQDLVVFKNRQGTEVCGNVRRATPFQVVFEVYSPEDAPAISEALPDCRVFLGDEVAFSGRAAIASVLDVGTGFLCEARLEEPLTRGKVTHTQNGGRAIAEEFGSFLRATQSMFKVRQDFKLVVADMQTFLLDFRRWADQFALRNLSGLAEKERVRLEREIIYQVQDS